jgi:hypothetical protein
MSRITDIASVIADAARAALNASLDAEEARERATAATGSVRSAREVLMLSLSDAATAGVWTETEIDKACADVAKSQNNDATAKTMATLLSEVKLAALPRVRPVFATLCAARDAAWDIEDQDKAAHKAAKAPGKFDGLLTRTFTRRYQTLVALMRAVNDGKASIASGDDVLAFARTRDPACDPEKMAAKMADAVNTLQRLGAAVEWRLPGLRAAVTGLLSLGAPEIAEAQRAMRDAMEGALAEALGDDADALSDDADAPSDDADDADAPSDDADGEHPDDNHRNEYLDNNHRNEYLDNNHRNEYLNEGGASKPVPQVQITDAELEALRALDEAA